MPSMDEVAPRRRRRKFTIALVTAIGVLATASGVGAYFLNRSDRQAEPPPPLALDEIGVRGAEAKCADPDRPEYQGYHELKPGDGHPPYSSDPPTSGWFRDDIQPGYYHVPVPDENALALAARGGIVVWTSEAESKNTRLFYVKAHRNDIVAVLNPDAKSGVVMVAWGVMVRCERFSGEAIMAFLERYSQGKALVFAEPSATPRI